MKRFCLVMTLIASAACGRGDAPKSTAATPAAGATPAVAADRKYLLERIDDAAVVQVYADGFPQLPLRDKMLVWHLYQAALAGRDIFYDQRYAHNIEMRDVIEAILTHGDAVDPDTRRD